ncbi:MAG: anti-sigma factor antagonist [Desulfobacteraceae bacterium]|nr:MAG: anti-sigma factor antagonist [Desulfobacteraceae bacterium]
MKESKAMEITMTRENERVHIKIMGDIDETGAEDLKRCFLGLDTIAIKEAVLDFKMVHYIGSAGIGKLLLLYKDLAIHGGKITIEHVSKQVYDMLKVVKLDSIFNIKQA